MPLIALRGVLQEMAVGLPAIGEALGSGRIYENNYKTLAIARFLTAGGVS
jgi:hypothetical protein